MLNAVPLKIRSSTEDPFTNYTLQRVALAWMCESPMHLKVEGTVKTDMARPTLESALG